MKTLATLLGSIVLSTVSAGAPGPDEKDTKTRKANFTISKETTYVTGPLDKEGYIDYVVALNERLSKGVTPETNANVLICQVLGPRPFRREKTPIAYFKALGIDAPPEKGEYFVDLNQLVRENAEVREDEDAIIGQLTIAVQYPWTAKEYPHVAAWLKANDKPLALLVEASKRPRCYAPLIAPDEKRDVSVLLRAPAAGIGGYWFGKALASRALLKLADGRTDEAWQDLLTCHRLARLFLKGARLMDVLGGIGIDQIACTADVVFLDRGRQTSGQLNDCLKELRALPSPPPMADKFEFAARFEFLDSLQVILRGGPRLLLAKLDKDAEEMGRRKLAAIDWDPVLRDANARYDRIVRAMRMNDRAACANEFREIDDDFHARRKWLKETEGLAKLIGDGAAPEGIIGKAVGDELFAMTVPSYAKARNWAESLEQRHRNLQIAFALAAHRRDQGKYPKTLDALAPKYLNKVPDDLFTGKQLVYKPTEVGYLLYSLGPNGKDDEGRGKDDERKGDDIAVRMPVPSAKR